MLHKSSIFTNLAVKSLMNYLDVQQMLTLRVHDFFWGYDDKLIEMASKLVPSWIDFQKLGIVDRVSVIQF